jgi:hypothetical protein
MDPCNVRDAEFVEQRAEHVLSQWNEDDDPGSLETLRNELKWFVKEYVKLADKGFLKRDFANRCRIFLKKDYLKIHPGTVRKEYLKKELQHLNCDFYADLLSKKGRR